MAEPVKAVFDTNILIDYLNGIGEAASEIALYSERLVSVITFIEVMAGARGDGDEKAIRAFLASFRVAELTTAIAAETVTIRQGLRLKIPDAVIYATARVEGCILVTRNTKDMKPEWPDIRVPYEL